MGAYLFVHFIGTESTEDSEQIYFSVSKDAAVWHTLNGKNPILKSTVGERGIRDPFIIKAHDSDKYFIIATDLSIFHRRDGGNPWRDCQTAESRSIIVWESNDLVSWSDAEMHEVAVPTAGCAWAPEAIYDPEQGMYIVYWASAIKEDDFKYQRMYRAYTSDFKTFTPAEVYIDNATEEEIANGTAAANIDTTIIEHNGEYFRFTKNESKSSVIMDRSKSLSNGWESVPTYNLGLMKGYEGPTIFKFHGENKWCLFLDHFAARKGYEPFVTTDLAKGEFVKSGECVFDDIYRHGTVIPITDDEYNRLLAAF